VSHTMPAPGDVIRVLTPGHKRPQTYVVLDQPAAFCGAVKAAMPSRKHPGDYRSAPHNIPLEWIVTGDQKEEK
jgi:hypothetical protein